MPWWRMKMLNITEEQINSRRLKMSLEDDLKKEIESYFPDAEIVRCVDLDIKLEGFTLAKQPKVMKDDKVLPSVLPGAWHWHIRESDEDLDFCIAKVRDQIACLEFLKPATKIYWRLNPVIEDIKTFKSAEVIHYITIRFTLGFSKGEINA